MLVADSVLNFAHAFGVGYFFWVLRYFLITGFFVSVFWLWRPRAFRNARIQVRKMDPRSLWREAGWSLSTLLIYELISRGVQWALDSGSSLAYWQVSDRGWPYLIFSVIAFIVLHDAYFYFTHRLLHHPVLFSRVHAIHHRSKDPSPLAAYSFHPVEAVVQAGFFLLILFVLPLHVVLVAVMTGVVLLMDVLGHLGYELYPWKRLTRSFWRWNNSSTHHNLHHQNGRWNFSLYFNWWDRLFGTMHPGYERAYEAVQARKHLAALKPEVIRRRARRAQAPRVAAIRTQGGTRPVRRSSARA